MQGGRAFCYNVAAMAFLPVILTLLVAQPTPAAPPPRIDLITMGTGGALYSIYGHAALRVVHSDGRDIAYNFGGVDIEVPFFWVNLMRGRVQAYLEVGKYSDLLLRYAGEDRTIVGRTLELTDAEARTIVARLENIASSDARFYFYHHVLDNCTTRIAQLLDETLGGTLSAQSTMPVRGTYRDWIIERVRNRAFLYVVMDLTGNAMGDVAITRWQTQFLPVGLEAIVDGARIGSRPFVQNQYLDYKSLNFDEPVLWDWPWTKVYIFLLAPLLLLALFAPRAATSIWCLLAGGWGLFYIALWLGSDYTFLHANWNTLNFPPTHFPVALLALRAKWWSRWRVQREAYLLLHASAVWLLALAWMLGWVHQALGPMLAFALPMATFLAARQSSLALSSIFRFSTAVTAWPSIHPREPV